MNVTSDLTIKTGMASTIGFTIVIILGAIYDLIGFDILGFSSFSKVIITVIYYYFYIYLLIIIRNILIKYYAIRKLKSTFDWLIKIEVIRSVLGVLSSIGIDSDLYYIFMLLGITVLLLYILLYIRILKIKKDDIPIIRHLQNLGKTVIPLFVVAVVIGTVMRILFDQNVIEIIPLLKIIPMIFIFIFLREYRIKELKNASSNILNN